MLVILDLFALSSSAPTITTFGVILYLDLNPLIILKCSLSLRSSEFR